jgi:hypothetical protein
MGYSAIEDPASLARRDNAIPTATRSSNTSMHKSWRFRMRAMIAQMEVARPFWKAPPMPSDHLSLAFLRPRIERQMIRTLFDKAIPHVRKPPFAKRRRAKRELQRCLDLMKVDPLDRTSKAGGERASRPQ